MSLDLYIGPMFAGKSSAVLGLIRRNAVIGRQTFCITSSLDTRYTSVPSIVSHNHESSPATALSSLMPAINSPAFHTAECIIIEEAQFFPDLEEFVLLAVEHHRKHVICVGLDGDSKRRPFGQLLNLIPYADKIQKFTALCGHCADGTEAIFTHRRTSVIQAQVAVGGQDTYEPLCRRHYLEAETEAETDTSINTLIQQNRHILDNPIINTISLDDYQRILNIGGGPSLR